MRKDDVSFRDGYACVNIKVPWRSLDTVVSELRGDGEIPETLTTEWIEENISEERLNAIFWFVCESEFEYFTDYAAEIMPGTTFHQDGRSGGWAVSNHSEYEVEGWDAIALAKWSKIERVARQIACGVYGQVVLSIYLNEYAPEAIYVDAAPVGEAIAAA